MTRRHRTFKVLLLPTCALVGFAVVFGLVRAERIIDYFKLTNRPGYEQCLQPDLVQLSVADADATDSDAEAQDLCYGMLRWPNHEINVVLLFDSVFKIEMNSTNVLLHFRASASWWTPPFTFQNQRNCMEIEELGFWKMLVLSDSEFQAWVQETDDAIHAEWTGNPIGIIDSSRVRAILYRVGSSYNVNAIIWNSSGGSFCRIQFVALNVDGSRSRNSALFVTAEFEREVLQFLSRFEVAGFDIRPPDEFEECLRSFQEDEDSWSNR